MVKSPDRYTAAGGRGWISPSHKNSPRFRRVVPDVFGTSEVVGLRRAPCPRFVVMDRCALVQDRIDHVPGRLDAVLTGKETSIASQGARQESLIGIDVGRRLT